MKPALSEKQVERIQLERFGEVSGLLPAGHIDDHEAPDFLVRTPEKVVGIELTTIFHKPQSSEHRRQAWESYVDKIVDGLAKVLIQTNLPPCWASIHFTKSAMQKIAVDSCIGEIFEVILSNFPAEGETVLIDAACTKRRLPGYVSALDLARLPEIDEWNITAPHALFIPDLDDQDELRAAIDKKDSKFGRYRESCDEIWLLINIGVGSPSTTFDVPDELAQQPVSSKFDRIFLVDHLSKRFWELPVTPKIST